VVLFVSYVLSFGIVAWIALRQVKFISKMESVNTRSW